MQIVFQVLYSGNHSLRDKIVKDTKLVDFKLKVSKYKKKDRSPGWAKLDSIEQGKCGVINMEWHSSSKMLLCRAITKGSGKPNHIISSFVNYLLSRYIKRIKLINILP